MFRNVFLLFAGLLLSACATTQLPNNLSSSILNSDDLGTVKDGLPSYLLMIDAMVKTYPKSESLHLTAASLNGAYAGVFVPAEDIDRKKKMSTKALKHAFMAFCLYDKKACDLDILDSEQLFETITQWTKVKDLPFLYTLGTSWASYIQAHSDDWLAIAQLGKAENVLTQVVAIDPSYEKGTALLYLGVMNSILPPSLGGKPAIAKSFYQRALEAGDSQNLIIYVYYASNYARLMFEQELHDQLLQQALSLDPYVDGYTLQNIYAQQLAKVLLASSYDYF